MKPYTPCQNGITLSCAEEVLYREFLPPSRLRTMVHCFWLLEAHCVADPFIYTVLPDACIDIVFDMHRVEAYVMTPATTAWQLNLGRTFSYTGIRLRPGAYSGDAAAVIGMSRQLDTVGGCSIQKVIARLRGADQGQLQSFCKLTDMMVCCGEVSSPHCVVEAVIAGCIQGKTVADSATEIGLSPRHVQRIVRQQTGFSPRDIAKIVRFQAGLTGDWRGLYCDQAHYIHNFKQVTQQTPVSYHRRYNV